MSIKVQMANTLYDVLIGTTRKKLKGRRDFMPPLMDKICHFRKLCSKILNILNALNLLFQFYYYR